jgi:Zn-dependent protease
MIFRSLGLLFRDPLAFFFVLGAVTLALLVAITVHEFSHALAAYRLGDDTAKRRGRLSLNPLVHLDPLGTLLLFVVGFGWGKPVPVNPYYLHRQPRWGMAIVSFAGPLSNLVVASLVALPLRLGLLSSGSLWSDIILYIILLNLILAIFNLIPLPPLDGSNIALAVLPPSLSRYLLQIGNYGPMILLLLLFLDAFSGLHIFWTIFGGIINLLSSLILGQGIF